jgi:hypothetical protein
VNKDAKVHSRRIQAVRIIEDIARYCDYQDHPNLPERTYKRGTLVKLFYAEATEGGRDSILEYFMRSLASPDDISNSIRDYSSIVSELSKFDDYSPTAKQRTIKRLQELSDHLADDFLLPCEFFCITVVPRCVSVADRAVKSEGCVRGTSSAKAFRFS